MEFEEINETIEEEVLEHKCDCKPGECTCEHEDCGCKNWEECTCEDCTCECECEEEE